MNSPWQGKYDGPLSDLDPFNTSDKGYVPKRHVFHQDHPETWPEVNEHLFVCLFNPVHKDHHWVVRKWAGDHFELTNFDIYWEVVAWIRTPPPPMSIEHYLTDGK